MIKWIKETWHATRAQMLKKKLRKLDLVKNEDEVYRIRLKRAKHLLYNSPGETYNVRLDKRYSSIIDDEEPTVEVLSTFYDYDENGEATGMTRAEGMYHRAHEAAKKTPGAAWD